ncbi:MAG: hypothetical protein H0W72_06945 [Planctomycetes bacterium]|nr:hypothetical protein [Planctomycetota bacterium]
MSVAEAMEGLRLADARLAALLYGDGVDPERFIPQAFVRWVAVDECMRALLRNILAAGAPLAPGSVDMGAISAAMDRKQSLVRILTAPTDREGAA